MNQLQSQKLSRLGVKHGFWGCGEIPEVDYHVKQVHGVKIAVVDKADSARKQVEADGVFSKIVNYTVAVKTADCLPILLCSSDSRYVAAVHAGWRGFAAGIIFETVKIFEKENILPSQIIAVIGPAIGKNAFEVGPEVVKAISDSPIGFSDKEMQAIATKGNGDRWHVDLHKGAALALVKAGLSEENIEILNVCTFSDENWNSYRRQKAYLGSNWAFISALRRLA